MAPDPIATAVDRFHQLFDTYDDVIVSFSGGKDSTAIMETGAIAARERGIRLTVWFFDEELIPSQTVEYVARVAQREDLDFKWWCLPIRELNGFSNESPFWYPWDPSERERWGRPLPEAGITDPMPGFVRERMLAMRDAVARANWPRTTVQVIGRRAAESPSRKIIQHNAGWLSPKITKAHPAAVSSPVIEWGNDEVWAVLMDNGWDWNRLYLKLYQAGIVRTQLRVGPLFGEDSSLNANRIRAFAPDVWAAAERRLPDAMAMARYARTAVFGRGRSAGEVGEVDREALIRLLDKMPPSRRQATLDSMRSVFMTQYRLRHPGAIKPADLLKMSLRGDTNSKDKGKRGRQGRLGVVLSGKILEEATKAGKYRKDRAASDIPFVARKAG